MELCTRFYALFFGLILFLSSSFLLHECRKLDGYEFPVYSTKSCPRNATEWNERSSAINCTEDNGYLCLPNENITQLLEFCYVFPFILIQEDICLYLSKRYSAVYSYDCNDFLYGCPNSSYVSYKLFKNPHCTSIGKGCFLAEPSCQGLTTTYQDTSENKESQIIFGLLGTIFGLSIITCLLYFFHTKRNRTCKRNDVENRNDEVFPLMFLNQHDKRVSTEDVLQLDKYIPEEWQKDNNFFVPTKACKEAEKLTKHQNFVIVAGHSGSGKTAIIQHIALKYKNRGWTVKPFYTVIDLMEIINSTKNNLENKIIAVLNDPIGKESFDEIKFNSWIKYEESLKECLKKIKLLVSCRIYILNDKRVKGILNDKSNIVDLSNDQLNLCKSEKKEIWQIYAPNEKVTKAELAKIVKSEAYFPLLCKLCFVNKIKKSERIKLFMEPAEIFEEKIRYFKTSCKEKYCALVILILFNNKFCVKYMQESDTLGKKYKAALELCDIKIDTAPHTIGDTLKTLEGFFVKKVGDTFEFYHDFVMEITSYVFGKDYPLFAIEHADIGFLRKRVRINTFNENNDKFIVNVSEKCSFTLGKRLYKDIFGDRLLDVVLNPCLNNEEVTKVLIEELERHPEKLKLLIEKKKIQIDNQDLNMISNHLLLSKLVFLSLQERISPLDAIIIFCKAKLSIYCLKALQKDTECSEWISLFPALCCNGSPEILETVLQNNFQAYMSEKWNGLHPIHIVSAFHNYKILNELLKVGVDVNLKTDNKKYFTPLIIAVGNDTEEDKDNCQSRRNETVELLLSNGADVNLCMENGASPLFIACQEGHDNIVHLLLRNGAKINLCKEKGESPLHIACKANHNEIVKRLLNNGADLNLRMEDGTSPLIEACQKGHNTTVQILLSYGTDINECMKNGSSPLLLACQNGHLCTAKLLLHNGANVNLSMKNKASPLHIACQNGHNSIVKHLLENGANINSFMENGTSPLVIACQKGHLNTVRILLHNGADINFCMKDGTSPLFIACQEGHSSIVELLLKKFADINLCKNDGASPLSVTCQMGHENIVHILLSSKADITLCMKDGSSPLYIACGEGHQKIVERLLEKGADVNKREKSGSSPFDIACQNRHVTIMELLLGNGADINACDEQGASPLYKACQREHESIVEILLKNGVKVNLCKKNGVSPLDIACQNGYESIVQLLLDSEADINLCNEFGASPLNIACEQGYDRIVQLLLSYGADINFCDEYGISPLYIACDHGFDNIVRLLMSNGAIINLCRNNGDSPLHIASKHKHVDIVQFLLNEGAGINICNEIEVCPLYIACERGHNSIVKLLLGNEANINLCEKNGISPLNIACQKGHDSVVQLLLNKGADINSCNKYGASPLHTSCQYGHTSIVRLLLSYGADINLCMKNGASPAFIANQQGHNSIVQLLRNEAKLAKVLHYSQGWK